MAAQTQRDGGADPFETFLHAPYPVADGFDSPDEATDGGVAEAVRAVAHGRVVEARGSNVVIEHTFYENHLRREVRSLYSGLRVVEVSAGEVVRRGRRIGARGKTFELQIVGDASTPETFIAARTDLFVPQQERELVILHHATRKLRHYRGGELVREVEIALGQLEGAKQWRGDLRTPAGMYFVVQKSKGPFSGDYADFYGGHWIKVNYPNVWDAQRGLEAGVVSATELETISQAWRERRLTLQGTALGGGIGFHGWVDEWEVDAGTSLSWGCVVLHNSDVPELYRELEIGTMVVMLE